MIPFVHGLEKGIVVLMLNHLTTFIQSMVRHERIPFLFICLFSFFDLIVNCFVFVLSLSSFVVVLSTTLENTNCNHVWETKTRRFYLPTTPQQRHRLRLNFFFLASVFFICCHVFIHTNTELLLC